MRKLRGPILITGASGFIGANLCNYFTKMGAEVVALEGPSEDSWRLNGLPELRICKRLKIDLRNRAEVEGAFNEIQPEVVVNCAAYGAYPNQSDPEKIYEINFSALRYMMEILRTQKRLRAFIQAGSSSEYGLNCKAPGENEATIPDSHYSVSKVAASSLVQFYGKKYGLPVWSLRLYSVYGPLEEISRLIPTLLIHAEKKTLPPLVNPTISRDFIYVEDVCDFVRVLIQKADEIEKGEIFNLGTGIKTTVADLVALARQEFSISEEARWGSMPDRKWDNSEWFADPSKIETILEWKPRTSLADGLRKTLNWMQSNPHLLQKANAFSVVKR